jgi:hypothetical protein
VESCDAVTFFKLGDALSDFVHNATEIRTLILRSATRIPVRRLPVFGVASTVDDPRQNLMRSRLRNRRVSDLDSWPWMNDSFFHIEKYRTGLLQQVEVRF